MTSIDLRAGPRESRLALIIRDWWFPLAAVAGSLLAQDVVLSSRSDVGGHAGEHLAGASAPFMAAVVVAILLWATPRARREVDVLVAAGGWFGTTLLVMMGNLRVVDGLVAAGYSRTPTGSVPDVADHSLANSSVWYAVAAALLVIAAFRRRRHIGTRATIGAIAATLVVPPWIIPGAGVIALAIIRLVQRARDHRIGQAGAPAAG